MVQNVPITVSAAVYQDLACAVCRNQPPASVFNSHTHFNLGWLYPSTPAPPESKPMPPIQPARKRDKILAEQKQVGYRHRTCLDIACRFTKRLTGVTVRNIDRVRPPQARCHRGCACLTVDEREISSTGSEWWD